MQSVILILHVVVCVLLVILVLLQAGKEGMGVIFGGGGSSMFGASGAGGILVKLTTFLAVIFIGTSLGYNIMTSSSKKVEKSVLDVQFEESVPAATTPAPVSNTVKETATPTATQQAEDSKATVPAEKAKENVKPSDTPKEGASKSEEISIKVETPVTPTDSPKAESASSTPAQDPTVNIPAEKAKENVKTSDSPKEEAPKTDAPSGNTPDASSQSTQEAK